MHVIILGHEKPEEASSMKLPLNNNIIPAKVQTNAASKRRVRFETENRIGFCKLIFYRNALRSE